MPHDPTRPRTASTPEDDESLFPVLTERGLLPFAQRRRPPGALLWRVVGALVWTGFCGWAWLAAGSGPVRSWGPDLGVWWVLLVGLVWAGGLWFAYAAGRDRTVGPADGYLAQLEPATYQALHDYVATPAAHPQVRRAELVAAWARLVRSVDRVRAAQAGRPDAVGPAHAELSAARRAVEAALGLGSARE